MGSHLGGVGQFGGKWEAEGEMPSKEHRLGVMEGLSSSF